MIRNISDDKSCLVRFDRRDCSCDDVTGVHQLETPCYAWTHSKIMINIKAVSNIQLTSEGIE